MNEMKENETEVVESNIEVENSVTESVNEESGNINLNEEIAENYKSAAELMIKFNSPNKANSLLKKALVNAVKTQNEDLISEINLLFNSLKACKHASSK